MPENKTEKQESRRDWGLLILRLGIGGMFVAHGLPKLLAGSEVWTGLGGAMKALGIDFAPTAWGFMAAVSETLGGALLALGFFSRTACVFLLSTMLVAIAMHLTRGDSFVKASHAIEAAILFFSLIWIGPGKYALDEKLAPHPENSGDLQR